MVSRAQAMASVEAYQQAIQQQQQQAQQQAQFQALIQALRGPQDPNAGQSKPGDAIGSLGKLFGGGSAAGGGGYGLSELFGGGSSATPMGLSDTAFLPGGSSFGTSSAAVGSAEGGGTMLANGEVVGGATPGFAASVVPPVAAVVGTVLAGKAALDMSQGKKPNPIGRAQLGYTTMGGSEVLNALFGGKPKTEVEDGRVQALVDKGLLSKDNSFRPTSDKHAWFRDDLAPDFVGSDDKGGWVNNKFAQSRDVKDLRAQDTAGYANWVEKYGTDYHALGADKRLQLNDFALKNNLLNEHHGTMDFQGDTSGLDNLFASLKSGGSPSMIPTSSSTPVKFSPKNPLVLKSNDFSPAVMSQVKKETHPTPMIKRSTTNSPGISKSGQR